jgi:hypothetical protein
MPSRSTLPDLRASHRRPHPSVDTYFIAFTLAG